MTPTAAQLAALHAAAFPAAAWPAADFARHLADPSCLVVAEADGFVLARRICDEAEILTLAVAPPARRQGLATLLLARALAGLAARGARRCVLEVAADNVAACALYARAGFTRVGQRRGYYPRAGAPAADAWLMACTPGAASHPAAAFCG